MVRVDGGEPYGTELGTEIVPLCAGSWRITDTRVPVTAPVGLLAYVEREGAGYSVMILRPAPLRTVAADSLEAALAIVEASRVPAAPTVPAAADATADLPAGDLSAVA